MEEAKDRTELRSAPDSEIENGSTESLIDPSVKKALYLGEDDLQSLKVRRRPVVKHAAFYELFFVLLLFAVTTTYTKTMPLHRRDIPQVTLPGGAVFNQTELSFPVFLNGASCYASTILKCDLEQASQSDPCCEVLLDPIHLGPEETVPFYQALAACILVPMAYFFLRTLFQRCGEKALKDTAGLGLSLTCGLFFIGVAKRLVGRPRPNFFALVAYASTSRAPRSHLEIVAHESFPSGHAGATMAAMLFLSLCVLRDYRNGYCRYLPRPLSLFVWIAAALPVFYSFWVGVTRIFDYWHSFDDVAVGWLVGGASAVFGFSYIKSGNTKRSNYRIPYRIDDGL